MIRLRGVVLALALLYLGSATLAVAGNVPVRTELNEEVEQQGAEGLEDYRAGVTFPVVV